MYLLIFLLLIAYSVLISHKIKYLDSIIIVFMCCLVFHGVTVPDFSMYETAYKYIQSGHQYSDLGVGWYWLCRLFGEFGFSYAFLKAVVFAFSGFLIKHTVDRFVKTSELRSIVWGLYLLYPALLDGVQIRFFLSESIVIFALPFLVSKRRVDRFKYLLLTTLAISFHSSAIFYLLFLFAPLMRHVKKIFLYIFIFISFVLFFGRKYVISLGMFLLNENRIDRYLTGSDGAGFFGVLAYTTTTVLFYVLMRKFYATVAQSTFTVEERNFFNLSVCISMISFLVLPMISFDPNFGRLQRILWILLYLQSAVLIENKNDRINVFGEKLRLSYCISFLALVANLAFICCFNFNIISDFFFV